MPLGFHVAAGFQFFLGLFEIFIRDFANSVSGLGSGVELLSLRVFAIRNQAKQSLCFPTGSIRCPR
jgi:hypothetical protein